MDNTSLKRPADVSVPQEQAGFTGLSSTDADKRPVIPQPLAAIPQKGRRRQQRAVNTSWQERVRIGTANVCTLRAGDFHKIDADLLE